MGIKLDGIDPMQEWGLIFLKDHYHPATPELRNKTITIPGMSGEWDFGSERGPKPFNLPFEMIEYNPFERQRKLNAFVAFLFDAYGKPRQIKLTFDYEPDKFYNVKLNAKLDVDRLVSSARFAVPFVAHKPEKKYIVSTEGITMNSEAWVLSDITIGAVYEYNITSNKTITIINDGSLAISPGIHISGRAGTLTLRTGGKSFTLTNISGTYIVDGNTFTVKKDGVNTLNAMTGDFLTLLPGENKVTVEGTGLNVKIEFKFHHQYN